MTIESYPALYQTVRLTLTTGSVVSGWWDGAQWWVGLPDDPNNLPVDNAYVISWSN